ncbi:MAG: head completion/stabilization protein [Caulobacteraceae bacterium]|nr:MAG: head completion/stabilization protein [Caulobacteraceae bacterium]
MTGFSFPQPPADDQPPAPLPAYADIQLDDFWPAVNMTAIRVAVRLGDAVTSDRLRDATENALVTIARQLGAWRLARQAEGCLALSDVRAREKIGGKSDYEILWFRAVYSEVGADLAERQLVAAATAAGLQRVEEVKSDADMHRRNASYAVRDFLAIGRVDAELL